MADENPYQPPESSELANADPPSGYLTTPQPITHMPPGVPYIVANEAAERFSFYGMRGILTVFMTSQLLGFDGQLDVMTESQATVVYHLFVFGAYACGLFGAVISDAFLGKYRTIITLSLVYCLGHLALALDETRIGLFAGLALIAVGSGGIKPCVSAHVGDQFGSKNRHLLEKVFGWFYLSINLGAFISGLVTPVLLKHHGPSVAFAVPGVLMALATVVFWAGRRKFIHVPAAGFGSMFSALTPENRRILWRLGAIYLCIAVFWSMFDQTGSTWVFQAQRMHIPTLDFSFLHSQLVFQTPAASVQSINPLLILIFVPLFTYVIYPAISRVYPLTPLRKIGIGFFLMSATFVLSAWIEMRLESLSAAKQSPLHIGWQLLGYVMLTASEVMVSITALEFSYTQAPKALKSMVMSLYLLSVAVGNLLASGITWLAQDAAGNSRLTQAEFFLLFAGLMLLAALAFIGIAVRYQARIELAE